MCGPTHRKSAQISPKSGLFINAQPYKANTMTNSSSATRILGADTRLLSRPALPVAALALGMLL